MQVKMPNLAINIKLEVRAQAENVTKDTEQNDDLHVTLAGLGAWSGLNSSTSLLVLRLLLDRERYVSRLSSSQSRALLSRNRACNDSSHPEVEGRASLSITGLAFSGWPANWTR